MITRVSHCSVFDKYRSNMTTVPGLTNKERTIVMSYGGWTKFLKAYDLKPGNDADLLEAKRLIALLLQEREEEEEE